MLERKLLELLELLRELVFADTDRRILRVRLPVLPQSSFADLPLDTRRQIQVA